MAKDESKSMGVFGAVNVGDEACWWDYGQLRLYRTNNSLLTGVSKRAIKHGYMAGFSYHNVCMRIIACRLIVS